MIMETNYCQTKPSSQNVTDILFNVIILIFTIIMVSYFSKHHNVRANFLMVATEHPTSPEIKIRFVFDFLSFLYLQRPVCTSSAIQRTLCFVQS